MDFALISNPDIKPLIKVTATNKCNNNSDVDVPN